MPMAIILSVATDASIPCYRAGGIAQISVHLSYEYMFLMQHARPLYKLSPLIQLFLAIVMLMVLSNFLQHSWHLF